MQVFENLSDISENYTGAVVAIGNFDGVHRGHQLILQTAKAKATELHKPFGVLTFEPHPKALFRPDDPPSRITPKDLKKWRLEEFGVDVLFSLNFDWDFASQTAQGFISSILKDAINASHVVVGDDFRFGQMRKGCPQGIKEAGIAVTPMSKLEEGGDALSSSRIRQALRNGDMGAANEILGWNWEIRGPIFKGDQRGRELGYPTANVKMEENIHPAYGVYASMVQIEGEDIWRPAATNIGIRPMFEIPLAQVESYIFDFDEEIYGKILRTRPVKRLRSEAKFETLEDLIAQMAKDCEQARKILA